MSDRLDKLAGDALIVGAGVAGLTCGVALAERGWRVRIVAEKHWRACASGKAGGLWLPYRIEPRRRVLEWSRRTLEVLTEMSADAANGVLMRQQVELYRDPHPPAAHTWWLSLVPEHRRLCGDELPPGYGSGVSARVPVMDVPVYMPRLEKRFQDAGGTIDITGSEVTSLESLLTKENLVINCTGLGSRKLCNDNELYPVRGQLLRTSNPGIDRCIADEMHPLGIAYVIARSGDCILGGTADENDESQEARDRDRQRLIDVNFLLEKKLRHADLIEDVVCIRPCRASVRLEIQQTPAGTILHNYGHGGAGFTVSWGCALEVAHLAAVAISERIR